MPSATIEVRTEVVRSPRVIQVEAMFDVPPSQWNGITWDVDLPIEKDDWNVGLIVGPSGSGKTTVAKQLFRRHLVKGFRWDKRRAVLDGFPPAMGVKDVVGLLTAVGFGSPPAWLRPFGVLSNGEQFRVNVARAMAETEGIVVIDEFTSVVDRQVAKVASHAIQKAIRRQKRKFIAVSCHYDIVDWLQPDWVYQPHTREFARRRLRRHPKMELQICAVDRAAWKLFAHHHYLNHRLSTRFFVGGFIGTECVAFAAWRKFPNPKWHNIMQAHRFVVLPDYQGLGIGRRMAEWVGQHLFDRGFRFHFITAHPAMIAGLNSSPRWKLLSYSRSSIVGSQKTNVDGSIRKVANNLSSLVRQSKLSARRRTASFVYVPADRKVERTAKSD